MRESEWLAGSSVGEMLAYVARPKLVPVTNPTPFHWAQRPPLATDRKLRLFAAACYRDVAAEADRIDCGGSAAAEQAERWAESGEPPVTHPNVRNLAAENFASAWQHAGAAASWAGYHRGARTLEELAAVQAAYLRCVMGDPFRLTTLCGVTEGIDSLSDCMTPHCPSCREILSWNGGTVKHLAEAIYADRAWEMMPGLADALEESGCTCEDIIRHCRGYQRCHNCIENGGKPCDVCRLCDPASVGWFPADPDNYRFPHGPHVRGCWVLDLLLGKS